MAENTATAGELPLLLKLWRNKESRAVIMQILVVLMVCVLGAWIVYNVNVNLSEIGKDVNFDFLFLTAGYDIHADQQWIYYDSTMSHLRAGVVGLLNTLYIAITGIIAATIIGFIVGVMRLSNNLMVAGIARVYVDIFRNVPTLLWILLFHGVIIYSLPVPRNAISLEDMVFFTNRGVYMPKPETGDLFFLTQIAILIGIVASYFYAKRAKKLQQQTGKISPVLLVSLGLIIGLPLVVFVVTGLPLEFSFAEKKGFNFAGGTVVKPEFLALWGALSLYTAAFIAEIVRAGISSVSQGQWEAAGALGLYNKRTLQLIVIPQAMRVIVPPLSSQYLNLTKNSSLAIAVGYMDVVATLGGISLNQTGRELECMSLVLLIYLTISLMISSFMNWYNARIKLVER